MKNFDMSLWLAEYEAEEASLDPHDSLYYVNETFEGTQYDY